MFVFKKKYIRKESILDVKLLILAIKLFITKLKLLIIDFRISREFLSTSNHSIKVVYFVHVSFAS